MPINYGKQSIDQRDIDSVLEVLKGDYITQGPKVEEFEISLRKKFGSQFCRVVSSGTAALHLTGLALGWKAEDIIITSPITFLSTVNSITYTGATPDFVDIDSQSYTIDPNKLRKKIQTYQNKGKKVKAVIGVDYAGHPCDWKSLKDIADEFELKLINDNCHALGAKYGGDDSYAIKFADIVTHSYHPVKHITTGEGGAVLTNDKKIDEKISILRSHGMTKDIEKMSKNDGPWYYELHEMGFNYRITDFQCALGISQLHKLDSFFKKRGKIAKKYNEIFGSEKRFKVPNVSKNVEHAYHLYPLQIEFSKNNLKKNKFFKIMKEKGINLQVHYIPVHLQPYYKKNFGFKDNDFPISEKFYQNVFSVPIYPGLKDKEIEHIASEIKKTL